jgi:hypothetical protein
MTIDGVDYQTISYVNGFDVSGRHGETVIIRAAWSAYTPFDNAGDPPTLPPALPAHFRFITAGEHYGWVKLRYRMV